MFITGRENNSADDLVLKLLCKMQGHHSHHQEWLGTITRKGLTRHFPKKLLKQPC